MRTPVRIRSLLTASCLLTVPFVEAIAGCPRSGGEQARRVVSAVVLLPAAPFILSHTPRTAPLPAAGAAVRVSRRGADDGVAFVRGTLVSLDSTAVTVATADNATERIPMAAVLCVQVPRRSRAAGAATGFAVGLVSGVATAGVIALGESSEGERKEAMSIGAFALGAIGGAGGALVGSVVRATSWDTVLDRTR